jgi:hypothetical protein
VTRHVTLPPIADSNVPNAVTTVPVQFPALTGRQFVITFTGVRQELAANYYSAGPLTLPIAIAEIGIPGVQVGAVPTNLPGNCVSNLLTIDGQPISVAVVGTASSALENGEEQIVPCGPDASGITLSAGTHVIESALGHTTTTGWNIDQLVLDSAPGGGAGFSASPTSAGVPSLPANQAGAAPDLTVHSVHIDSESASITGATSPFELVLGQSVNAGWEAVATRGAHSVNLGPSQLVDSFANGWSVTAPELKALGGSAFTVTLTWTPQRKVWLALGASALALLFCLFVILLPERLRRPLRRRIPKLLRGTPAQVVDTHEEPKIDLLLSDYRPKVSLLRSIGFAAITGLVAASVTTLATGLIVAVVIIAGLWVRQGRWIAMAGGFGFITAGALSVIFGQAAHHYLPGSNWAGSFVSSGNLILAGTVLLVADAVMVIAAERTPRPAPPTTDEPSLPT